MRILWELGEGVVHDIVARLPEPKPPYTTVSSTVATGRGLMQRSVTSNTPPACGRAPT